MCNLQRISSRFSLWLQAMRPIGTSVIHPSGNKDQQGLNLDRAGGAGS
jgi:hypothetical protein